MVLSSMSDTSRIRGNDRGESFQAPQTLEPHPQIRYQPSWTISIFVVLVDRDIKPVRNVPTLKDLHRRSFLPKLQKVDPSLISQSSLDFTNKLFPALRLCTHLCSVCLPSSVAWLRHTGSSTMGRPSGTRRSRTCWTRACCGCSWVSTRALQHDLARAIVATVDRLIVNLLKFDFSSLF